MVSINRRMHLDAHDRVTLAHGVLTAAQCRADRHKPCPGAQPSATYVNCVQALVDAVGEYGDAVAALGAILHWQDTIATGEKKPAESEHLSPYGVSDR
jgi:hypothetical protein